MTTDLERYEDAHAIPRGELTRRGWKTCVHNGRPAIAFPTESGPRWRFMDGRKPKYDHASTYKACWYGLKEAVQLDFAFLIDCNGAASTIAALCAGLPAFSYQSGEMTKPTPEAIAELKARWKGRVWVVFDCDADGRRGAIKRVRLYREHGFQAQAIDLGLEKSGADLADFVAAHPRDVFTALLACKRIEIPVDLSLADKPKEKKRKPHVPRTQDEADNIELAQLALDALDPWRRDTYYAWVEVGMALYELGEAGLQLWDRWSSASDKYKPGECAKKFRTFSGKMTLASLFYYADTDFGPSWRPYRQRPSPIGETTTKPEYPECLPVAVRGALNAYAHASVAPVLELWLEGIRIGLLEPGEGATVECLKHIADVSERGLSIHTIRTGLRHMTDPHGAVFLRVLQDHIDLQEEQTPESKQKVTYRNPCKRSGRIPGLYQLLPWKEILDRLTQLSIAPIIQRAFPADDDLVAPIRAEFLAQLGQSDADSLAADLTKRYGAVLARQPGYREALGRARKEYKRLRWLLANPQIAPIPKGWTYKNSPEYVACCARAIVEAAGGETQYSHKRLVEMIGCSLRNLKTVLARAGIWIAKEGTTVDRPVKNMAGLRAARGYNTAVQGYAVAVVSSLNSAPYPLEKKGALVWAEGELKKGATVSVRYQQAHRQLLDTTEQPRKHGPRLLWSAVVFIRALLNLLVCWLRAEPERAREASPWVRLAVQLRLARLVDWLARNVRPTRRECYGEVQIRKLVNLATDYRADPDRIVDRGTGEVMDYTVQTALDLLQDKPPGTAPPGDLEWCRDHSVA